MISRSGALEWLEITVVTVIELTQTLKSELDTLTITEHKKTIEHIQQVPRSVLFDCVIVGDAKTPCCPHCGSVSVVRTVH